MEENDFKPALIIVDLQEDFCPPNGSLAVPHGRDIIPIVNTLLTLPFALKIGTKDWHPRDHISFASNHPGKKPFEDMVTITNPSNPAEKYESRLWPVHCVQGTPGAELVIELDTERLDRVIEKGQMREVEMYSAFYDPLDRPRCCDSGLKDVLKKEGISDVYVVGLAGDYCVRATAMDAKREGYRTWVVGEGTRAVDEGRWEGRVEEIRGEGVGVVGMDGEEVRRVREWRG
ncbi:Isochorismatase-like protein [Amylocarpus encephaloides]|uniref:nicotinamidase n=1 Tax=Amylocarpus encephaloides TaxID=45428 RepID=A0A9P7YMK3_9HELO|nr:Isochorismatase-like protein [Amylocarpus encephaloides]